jgi:hypothetical protein
LFAFSPHVVSGNELTFDRDNGFGMIGNAKKLEFVE